MMDASSVSLLKPRLRLLRRRSTLDDDHGKDTADLASSSEEEDEQPAPLLSLGAPPADPDTPAARLRALLSLTPRSPPVGSSIARENLNELFSRVLDSDISSDSAHETAPQGAWMGTPNQPTMKPVTVDPPVSSLASNSLPPRTPAPPGAWAATPNQPPVKAVTVDTPVLSLPSNSLPLFTPAPPGAWMVTPNQPTARALTINDSQFGSFGKRRSLLKVRFDVSESEGSIVGDDSSALLSGIGLRNPEPPELPDPQGSPSSPRSLHRSPMVRVVDAYGRDADDATASEGSSSQSDHADMMDTHSPSRPIVPASSTNTSDAVARMKLTLRELQQDLSDADRSADELGFTPDHLAKLEQVSTSARLARSELVQKAQREAARESEISINYSIQKAPPWTKRLLNGASVHRRRWNRTLVYSSLFIQLLLVLVMWRYAHIEARRLFYTTYYDPLYPELHSLDGSPYFLSPSSSWDVPFSWESIRRGGWRTAIMEIGRAFRHARDRTWDGWRTSLYSGAERPT